MVRQAFRPASLYLVAIRSSALPQWLYSLYSYSDRCTTNERPEQPLSPLSSRDSSKLLSRGRDRDACRSTHKETANVRWLRKRCVHVEPRLAHLDLLLEENVDEQKRRGAPRAQPSLPLGAVSSSPRFESDKVCVLMRQDQQIEKENKRERGSRPRRARESGGYDLPLLPFGF